MTGFLRSRQSPARWAFRWLAGRDLDGRHRTDATFLRSGTQHQHVTLIRKWSWRPGWQRSAYRQAGLVLAVAAPYGWFWHRTAAWSVAGCLAATGTVLGIRRVRTWRTERRMRTTYVRPLEASLRPLLRIPLTESPDTWISVPENFATDEKTPAEIRLPAEWLPTDGAKKMLSAAVMDKLGVSPDTADATFRMVGVPTLIISAAPQPPARVPWVSVTEQMEACRPGEVVLGVAARGLVYRADFNGDNPHWAFSVNTGRGKSTQLLSIAAQTLHQDPRAEVDAVDPKMTSFAALQGVPRFNLANDPEDVEGMWAVIEGAYAEMALRRAALAADPTLEFPTRLLLLDELNTFNAMTKARWMDIREPGQGATAPVASTLAQLAWQGRQFRVFVVAVGQRLDDRAFGYPGVRDSFGFRGLAGYRKNQWQMLVGTTPVPAAQKGKGRWIYVADDEQTWVQNVYGTPEELRSWATSLAPVRADVPCPTPPNTQVNSEVGQEVGQEFVVGWEPAAGRLGITVAALRKREQRGLIARSGSKSNRPVFLLADLDAQRVQVD